MVAFLAFLAGPIGRWLVVAALVVAFVAGVKYKWKQEGWDDRDAIAQAETAARDKREADLVARQIAKLTAYRNELDAKLAVANARVAELEGKVKRLYAQLNTQVPIYVTPEADKRIQDCGGIPAGFVMLHDAAARGDTAAGPLPTAPESRVVNADSGVALSAIQSVVVSNYEQFYRCNTALKAWEAWYPTAKDIYERNLQ